MDRVASQRPAPVLGVILAGGDSRRFGRDKALVLLGGVSLLQRMIALVRPQVDALALSGAPRPDISLPAIDDAVKGAGPLAALCAVLAWAEERDFPLVATFSCDTPFLPRDIVAGLRAVLDGRRDCAVANHGGVVHPTCALWKVAARGKVEAAFAGGVRSLHGLIGRLDGAAAGFSATDGPDGDPFFNINSQQDLTRAQAWLDGVPT